MHLDRGDIDSTIDRLEKNESVQSAKDAFIRSIEDDMLYKYEDWIAIIISRAITLGDLIWNSLDDKEKLSFYDIRNKLLNPKYEQILNKMIAQLLLRQPIVYLKRRIVLLEEEREGEDPSKLKDYTENTRLLMRLVATIIIDEKRFGLIPSVRGVYQQIEKPGDLFEAIQILAGNAYALYIEVWEILKNQDELHNPGELVTYVSLVEHVIEIRQNEIDDITICTKEINQLILGNEMSNTGNALSELWEFYGKDIGKLYKNLVTKQAKIDYTQIQKES